jgi:DNA-binding NarL/FixJ family response regulator
MAEAARVRRNGRSGRRKLFLFCGHPLAQEQFTQILSRTRFDVALSSELRVPLEDAHSFDALEPCVAVVDGGDSLATLGFVRSLRNEQRSVNLLVLLPCWEENFNFSLLRLGVKGLLTYERAPRELGRAASRVAAAATGYRVNCWLALWKPCCRSYKVASHWTTKLRSAAANAKCSICCSITFPTRKLPADCLSPSARLNFTSPTC